MFDAVHFHIFRNGPFFDVRQDVIAIDSIFANIALLAKLHEAPTRTPLFKRQHILQDAFERRWVR
jgi:hypothetical protein